MRAQNSTKAQASRYGPRLKELRQQHEVSTQQIWEHVGCSDTYIRRIEHGDLRPTPAILEAYAACCGVKLEDFLNAEEIVELMAAGKKSSCGKCGQGGHNARSCKNRSATPTDKPWQLPRKRTARKRVRPVRTAELREDQAKPKTPANEPEIRGSAPEAVARDPELEYYRSLVTCSDCESPHSAPPKRPGVLRTRDTKPRCDPCYSRYLLSQPPVGRESWDPKGLTLKPTIDLQIVVEPIYEEEWPRESVPS